MAGVIAALRNEHVRAHKILYGSRSIKVERDESDDLVCRVPNERHRKHEYELENLLNR